ncbi:MAG: stage II sporulation protein M [Cytophagaceae bacterium]
MRETAFLKINEAKWKKFEGLLVNRKAQQPDLLAELFVEVTEDLSYSKTHYPESTTTKYLNAMALRFHQAIYKNKKEEKGRFGKFWKYELPFLFKAHHRELLYAFIIFMIACLIGAVSAAYDDRFVRLILGDSYVNMTLENIEKGDPMAVYKKMDSGVMFLYITWNNIKVSFFAFVLGLFFSFGTGYMLFNNGVMLGSFQYFFYKKGLLLTSFLTIWIHGTLEISAIVIAGCAGLVMGNSILFPGTYTRMESFKKGAKNGLKIVVGLIPIFIAAGFLESFITRHTEYPSAVKAGIILVSAAFIIYYFILYPIKLHTHANRENSIRPQQGLQ